MAEARFDSDDDDDGPPPPDLRAVKIAVAVMTGFLFFSAAALLLVIFFRLAGGDESDASLNADTPAPFGAPAGEDDAPPLYEPPLGAPWWEGSRFISKLSVPEDGEVRQMTIAGDRLALLIDRPDGREIILFDLIELRELGVIRLTSDDVMDEALREAFRDTPRIGAVPPDDGPADE